ncbi:UV DNA damage repair endonuclease UvsE [Paenactinomyces guangxiensis]|uniref:UV DNA damage repair endonuclease UvsE n=1 Tax=Paenactinomyces guangxiensis TaxID=1490290 RepID=A0A7W1WPD2_9BACL|nr:UV DNA damage repair endonuclease UvsE [Paenactinomyces guangxiensis]MBA4493545.1 UV DNA damage repair endonuclease UvsE [Paenactinomyces guangxiensis]MBH8590636.1 UV DNA damage repair endonuclease UvsE [Paenactinomyces guangxiensis]
MLIRFGFVAMSMNVLNSSPSKTITVKTFKKIRDKNAAIRKIIRISKENIHNTRRIIYHAVANDIYFYRFSSRLIPLLGHPLLEGKDLIRELRREFKDLGNLIREKRMRVGFHPEHFTVLNSPKKNVVKASVQDLIHHVKMLRAMGLNSFYKCNIHVGGVYGNKESAGQRFIDHFKRLNPLIQAYICLENDDRTFTARETLDIAQRVGVPMVLDLHHHKVNNHGETVEELWPHIVQTWEKEKFPPKIHISSPKNDKEVLNHADFVNPNDLLPFLRIAQASTDRLDVMIEAKMKDEALFRLMDELEAIDGIERVNQASLKYLPF